MLRASKEEIPEMLKAEAKGTEKEYVIQRNDLLTIDIYSNKGERLIDPNPELSSDNASGAANAKGESEKPKYLIDANGLTKLPMIGEMKLESLTLRQAEEVVQKEY